MIHAIILTFDEAQHILRCLESLKGVVAQETVQRPASASAPSHQCQAAWWSWM